MTIYPCRNCYGIGTLSLVLQDEPLWEDILPAYSEYSITIEVIPLNDPPNIILLADDGESMLLPDPTEEILIFRDQTEIPFTLNLGTIVTFDIDGLQQLDIISSSETSSGTFNLTDMMIEKVFDMVSCDNTKCDFFDLNIPPPEAAWKSARITYSLINDSFFGIDRIKVAAMDSNGTFSDVITVTVVVMENKCIHGNCKSLNHRQYTCNDTRRAVSFDQFYTCECPLSWQGPYCEHDTDECLLGLCEAWKICENTVGSFNCYCKSSDIICKLSLKEWEFAIIVVAIITVIAALIGIVIFRVHKAKKAKALEKNKLGSAEEDTFTTFRETLGPAKQFFRWSAAATPQVAQKMEEEDDEMFVHPEPNWNHNASMDAAHLQEALTNHGILEDNVVPPMSVFIRHPMRTTHERPMHPHKKFAAMELQQLARELRKSKKANEHGHIDAMETVTTRLSFSNDAKPEASFPMQSKDNKDVDFNAYHDRDTESISTAASIPPTLGNENEDGRHSRQSAITMAEVNLTNEEMAEVEC